MATPRDHKLALVHLERLHKCFTEAVKYVERLAPVATKSSKTTRTKVGRPAGRPPGRPKQTTSVKQRAVA